MILVLNFCFMNYYGTASRCLLKVMVIAVHGSHVLVHAGLPVHFRYQLDGLSHEERVVCIARR